MSTILAAMDDPDAFGPFFRGESYGRWRVWLASLFGLPLVGDALPIYQHHTGRTEPPTSPFKEASLIVGRRGGKSRVLALVATFLATARRYEQFLAPGEVATVSVIAADRKQARTIFRYIAGMLDAVPAARAMVREQTSESITLSNRVVIEIHTASFRVTRGYTLVAALCDEVAFWRSDEGANPAGEIIRALRPALSSIPCSLLLIASSPYAKRGLLWDTFKRHWGKDDGRVLVWRGTTAEMNPLVDSGIIEEAYADDPESASAEYGAEFRSDIAAFVSREVVDAATVPRRFELGAVSGVQYRAFVDPSGGSSDSMTLAIAHQEGETAVLDAVRERKPPFSPEDVVQEFAALLKLYGLTEVTGDRYAGEWPRERFKVHGIDYVVSEKSKSDIYRDFLPVLNARRVELLDHARLTQQLVGLERRTARGGRDSIDHGPGSHDDAANAVAGALLMVGRKPGFDSSYSWVSGDDDGSAWRFGGQGMIYG